MNKKAFVQEGLLELLLVLEEGNAENKVSHRIAWLCASMSDDRVRRTWDMGCCTPVLISCCPSSKRWHTKGKQIFRRVSQLTLRPKGHLTRIPEQCDRRLPWDQRKRQHCISSEWWHYACEAFLLAWRNGCRLQRRNQAAAQRTAKQIVEPTPFEGICAASSSQRSDVDNLCGAQQPPKYLT